MYSVFQCSGNSSGVNQGVGRCELRADSVQIQGIGIMEGVLGADQGRLSLAIIPSNDVDSNEPAFQTAEGSVDDARAVREKHPDRECGVAALALLQHRKKLWRSVEKTLLTTLTYHADGG